MMCDGEEGGARVRRNILIDCKKLCCLAGDLDVKHLKELKLIYILQVCRWIGQSRGDWEQQQ